MAVKETSGHVLTVGDKVRMNIPVIGAGDLDGIEVTATGKDYWRYMNEHPDEVYTITKYDLDHEDCPYRLSGYMSDNTWASDELIHVPEPQNRFEPLKNMTVEEMARELIPMVMELCEDGVPSEELVLDWLNSLETKENGEDGFELVTYIARTSTPEIMGSGSTVSNEVRTKNLEEAFQLLADGRNELLRVVKIGPDKRTHYWDSDKMGWVE